MKKDKKQRVRVDFSGFKKEEQDRMKDVLDRLARATEPKETKRGGESVDAH